MNNDLIKFPVRFCYKDSTYYCLNSWKHLFKEWGIDHMKDLMAEEYQCHEYANSDNTFHYIDKSILIGNAVNLFRVKEYLQEFSNLNPKRYLSERIDIFTPALLSYIREDKRMKMIHMRAEGEMYLDEKNIHSRILYKLLGVFE